MQTVFITGGNSGLGFETAKQFLLANYSVTIGCRDINKAEKSKQALISETKKENISIVLLDLASFESIRACVKKFNTPIDILICNAGVAFNSLGHFTLDGIEETFGVNHLGHFLLTNLFLKKFNSIKKIVCVSSAVHNPKTSGGVFPPPGITTIKKLAYPDDESVKDINREASLRYVNSKLCNLWFVYELNRKLQTVGKKDVVINAFNPGFIPNTNLARNSSALMQFMLKYIFPYLKFMMKGIKTSEASAKDIVHIIQHETVSGKYFDGSKETPSSEFSYNTSKAAELWNESLQLTKLTPAENCFV